MSERYQPQIYASRVVSRVERGLQPWQNSGKCHCGKTGIYTCETVESKQFFFCSDHRADCIAMQKSRCHKWGHGTEALTKAQVRAQMKRDQSGREVVDCPMCSEQFSPRGLGPHMKKRHGESLVKYRAAQ